MKTFTQLIESFQSGNRNTSSKYGNDSGKRTKDEEMAVAVQSAIYKKTQYQGYDIVPSVHAAAQAFDRRPDFTFDDWKKIHRSAIDVFNKNKVDGDYIFFSKSLDQGYVANMSGRSKTMRIITVLPKGRKNPMPGTKQVMVESKLIDIIETIILD